MEIGVAVVFACLCFGLGGYFAGKHEIREKSTYDTRMPFEAKVALSSFGLGTMFLAYALG